MKNIVIFGASGHGAVVLDCLEKEGQYNIVGFVDSYKKKGRLHCGYKILGSEFDLPFLVEKFNLYGGIIAIGDNWSRKLVSTKILKLVPGFAFVSTAHPSATIGKNVHVGKGTVIAPGAIINANSWIGDHCILNTNSSLGHDGRMDHYSSLAPRACAGGNLALGSFAAVCLGVNIIENITIGEHSVIGAGSLVINDIESYTVSYGSPTKLIRTRSVGDAYLGRNGKSAMLSFITEDF